MVEGDGEEGYLTGERVQEGVSEPFQVRDRRTEASQKPDQLMLTHKVQSIKKVGKDRASLLQKKKINTVEDFLKGYYSDETALREILGIKSESDKSWVYMVEHAMQCADEFHTKNASNNSSQPRQVSRDIGVNNLNPYTNKFEDQFGISSERTNVERGKILNGNSAQHTNVGDAQSSHNYNPQVPSGGGGYGNGHGRSPRSFTQRDTTALRDRSGGPPPPSCQARSVMFKFYSSP